MPSDCTHLFGTSLVELGQEQLTRAERWVGRKFFAKPFVQGKKKILFVLGHMRSGSSLLTHILCSHDDITGYGETQNAYCTPVDFGATAAKVYRKLRKIPGGELYLLDKVLHKDLIARRDVLTHSSVKIIFLLRDPEEALSSILRSFDFVQQPAEAYQHYETQLEWICSVSEQLPSEKWIYTTYDELISDTSAVLRRLKNFLDLSEPLSESYETTRYTGTPGIGDSGPNIQAGHIKRDIDHQVCSDIQPYVTPASDQFNRCICVLN